MSETGGVLAVRRGDPWEMNLLRTPPAVPLESQADMPVPAAPKTEFERQLVDLNAGVWLRRDAIAAGLTDRDIRALRRGGEWARVRWGAYTAGEVWRCASPERRHLLRAMAVARTANCEFRLSHITSVLLAGGTVWGVGLDDVHLTRPDGRAGRREAGVIQHRGRLPDGPRHLAGGLPVTPPARAFAEALTLEGVGVEQGVVMANALLHRGVVTKAELAGALNEVTRWPGSTPRHTVMPLTDPRIASVGESRSVVFFVRHGLGMPQLQVEVRDGSGRLLGRVDFYLPDLGVFVEFDGLAKYDVHRRPGESVADAVLREKQRDDLIYRATGIPMFHMGWSDLRQPDRLEAEIRARRRS